MGKRHRDPSLEKSSDASRLVNSEYGAKDVSISVPVLLQDLLLELREFHRDVVNLLNSFAHFKDDIRGIHRNIATENEVDERPFVRLHQRRKISGKAAAYKQSATDTDSEAIDPFPTDGEQKDAFSNHFQVQSRLQTGDVFATDPASHDMDTSLHKITLDDSESLHISEQRQRAAFAPIASPVTNNVLNEMGGKKVDCSPSHVPKNALDHAKETLLSNPPEALQLVRKEAAAGSIEAMIAAAGILCNGAWAGPDNFVQRNYVEALWWLDHALSIDASNVSALNLRGEMIRVGHGCQVDEQEAIECFERAADLNDAEARYRLGHCLVITSKKLTGTCKSRAQCIRGKSLLEQSLREGEGRAAVILGHFYEHPELTGVGDVFGADMPALEREKVAYEFYERSATMGVAAGMNNVGSCWSTAFAGLTASFDTALEYFKKAWEAGSLDAGDNAGLLFESGAGGRFPDKIDMCEALKWYNLGYERGHARSALHLGNAYDDGNGVPEDKTKAEMYYVRARELASGCEDDWVISEINQDIEALLLTQAVLRLSERERWLQKLESYAGKERAEMRRKELTTILASASLQNFVGIYESTELVGSDAKLELFDFVGERNATKLLNLVSFTIKQFDDALQSRDSEMEMAAYSFLERMLDKKQAEIIGEARKRYRPRSMRERRTPQTGRANRGRLHSRSGSVSVTTRRGGKRGRTGRLGSSS